MSLSTMKSPVVGSREVRGRGMQSSLLNVQSLRDVRFLGVLQFVFTFI
jgi:hypothetical protein